jgi:hypothetical protein
MRTIYGLEAVLGWKTQEGEMMTSKKINMAIVLFFGLMAGASAHAQAFNVSLDGYCNTFALTISSWEVYGTRSGCGYTVIDGGAVAFVGVPSKRYYTAFDSEDLNELYSWFFTKPNKKGKGNWFLYKSIGSSDVLLNSGTYTQTPAGQEPTNTSDQDATAFKKR